MKEKRQDASNVLSRPRALPVASEPEEVEVGRRSSTRAALFIFAATLTVAVPTGPAASAVAAPSNDAFGSAVDLTTVPASRNGSNSGATLEPGEPTPCGEIGATVWYRLTTSADVNVVADTLGSGYDTVLAAYTGASLQALEDLDCNDDTDENLQSRVGFSARAGEPVYLQLGGFDGDTGSFKLNLAVGGALSGSVTDQQGAPLDQICVQAIAPTAYEGSEVVTDQAGRYRFGALSPGDYQIRFSDCAEEPRVSGEWYDARTTRAEADTIQVAAGAETTGIDASLAPAATIRGRVTVADGSPVDEVCVIGRSADVPFEEYDEDLFGLTDGDGRYVLGGASAGRYKIEFYPCGEEGHAGEWYDDQDSFESADVIDLSPGEDRSGVDAVLTEGGSIAGRVTDESGTPVPFGCVVAVDRDGDYAGYGDTDGSGDYEVLGLHAGSYRVRFGDCDAGELAAEWYDDRPDRATADEVTVTDGARTSGIDARLGPGGSISGRVTDRGGEALPYIYVGVYDPAEDELAWGFTDEDGTYEVGGLPAGEHRVTFEDWDQDLYTAEWYDDRGSFAAATPVSLASGGRVDGIDAVLDRFRVVVGETEGGTTVEEGGASDTYTLQLTAPPSHPVQVTVETDASQLTAVPVTVTFTEDAWDVPQAVVVSAVDDDAAEGLHVVPVGHLVSSEDPRFDGVTVPDVDVLIRDDELRATETEVSYEGPASGIRGQDVTLEAVLSDADSGAPIPGAEVSFTLEDMEAFGVTDVTGRAEATVTLDLDPGPYQVQVGYAGDPEHFGAQASAPFEVRWHYTFEDQDGAGRVHLNPLTEEFRVVTASIDTGIVWEPNMLVAGPTGALVTVVHRGPVIDLTGEFDLAGGRFAAAGRSGTQPFALRRAP